jgi:DNA-binding GntR family transcriptional regulator
MPPHKESLRYVQKDVVAVMIERYEQCGAKKDDVRYLRKHGVGFRSVIAQASKKKVILALLRCWYSASLIAIYLLENDEGIKRHYKESEPEKAQQALKRSINRFRKRLPCLCLDDVKIEPQFKL